VAGQGKLADEIRTGLMVEPPHNLDDIAPQTVSFLDTVWEGKQVRRHIAEFGYLFATISAGLAAYRLWHGAPMGATFPLWSASIALIAAGRYAPTVLWPLWKGWMTFAKLLSLIMTPVILAVLWFMVLAPTALALRMIGKRVMDLSFKAPVDSYWIDRPESKHNFKRLERMF
jgi:hypothetical protein